MLTSNRFYIDDKGSNSTNIDITGDDTSDNTSGNTSGSAIIADK